MKKNKKNSCLIVNMIKEWFNIFMGKTIFIHPCTKLDAWHEDSEQGKLA